MAKLLLKDAMRLGDLPRPGFVGAGGKTTAMFRLARELPPPVLVSNTTHLAVEQAHLADTHRILIKDGDFSGLAEARWDAVTLLTGPETPDGRLQGLGPAAMEVIHTVADALRLPLLIEADGSRRLPLKAPAPYEPVLPAWVDPLVVVAGLSGLGQPLTDSWVHRSELFGVLAGLQAGEEITVAALARVLAHVNGGLKSAPSGARRVAILNGADSAIKQAQGLALSSLLLPDFHVVIVASLQQGAIFAVHERVAGIILAAGEAQRMGSPKQLLPWAGEPLVRRAARTALAAGLSPIVVVTGAAADAVGRAVEDLPVQIVYNTSWQSGQSSSLQAGLQALPAEIGAAIFLLADQPYVPPELLRELVALHARTVSPLVAPQADGRRANPVLFDRITFPDLYSVTGDVGGRALFARYPVAWLPWLDARLLLDVDTPEDYRRMVAG